MIFDKIIDEPGMLDLVRRLTDDGSLKLVATSAQRREHEKAPERRNALRSVPAHYTGTAGFVLDHSQLDVDRFGPEEPIHAVRPKRGTKHLEDALTAATALFDGYPLVTEDGRLQRKAKDELGLEVWDWADLRQRLETARPV